MNNPPSTFAMGGPAPAPAFSLSTLHTVALRPEYQRILEQVTPGATGPEPWRRRKLAAAHELLALAQVSGRMLIQMLDLTQAFRTVFTLRVPVPCRGAEAGPRPEPFGGPLQVAPAAELGLTYRQEAMLSAQPGYSFIEILQPRTVFHSNVADGTQPPGAQLLCLGAKLPPNTQLVDLVLMAYTAISLQTIQFSLVDPGGVLNPAAALWFQANPTCIPLTREPFLPTKEARQ